MAKVKYYAKENSSIGTHSFYDVPIPNGTLTFDELLEEATTTIRQAGNWRDDLRDVRWKRADGCRLSSFFLKYLNFLPYYL